MSEEQVLARLIGQVYEAGLGTASWETALDEIVRALDAEVAALFVNDYAAPDGAFDVLALCGYPDYVPQAYQSYFAGRDVRLPAIARLDATQSYVDDRTMPFAEVRRSEIFQDFYRPMGIGHGIAMRPFAEGDRTGILSAHRALEAGAFRDNQIALFDRLSPHVARSLQLQRQVTRAQAIAGGLSVALNHFNLAVLLLDAHARVLEMNSAAEALLRRPGTPLRVSGKRLAAIAQDGGAAVRPAIAAAAQITRGGVVPPSPVVRLPKTHGSGHIGVLAVAARRGDALGVPREALVLLFVSDPDNAVRAAPELLSAQFGLSATEAQIAAQLAAGDRIEDIADARRVSRETVRAQVKSVLGKTETRSQGQLVALVGRSLAALRPNSLFPPRGRAGK